MRTVDEVRLNYLDNSQPSLARISLRLNSFQAARRSSEIQPGVVAA
jgi:hypothetical protein